MTTTKAPVTVFDRPHTQHPWDTLIDRGESSDTPGHPALAANWRMDHRLSPAHESQLGKRGFPAVSKDLPEAVQAFHYQAQCRPATDQPPPFFLEGSNALNRIPVDQLAGSVRLIHLASLNRLLRFALGSHAPGHADIALYLFRTFNLLPPNLDDAPTYRIYCDQLADALTRAGASTLCDFAGRLADALGPSEPFWWAAFAHDIEPLLAGDDWSDAVDQLGLGHLEAGEWLLAWHYSPDDAGPLYRPTVVEAGNNACHHPSPPGSPYGLTQSLADRAIGVAELVHAPLKGNEAEDNNLGRLGKLVKPAAPHVKNAAGLRQWFKERRQQHRQLLAHSFPDDADQAWLNRHHTRP